MKYRIKAAATLVLGLMAGGLLRLLFASCRVRYSGVDNIRAAETAGAICSRCGTNTHSMAAPATPSCRSARW